MDVEFLIQNISKKSPPIAELTEIIGRTGVACNTHVIRLMVSVWPGG